ncbi:MAG: host attachment protein [Lamprobacter sp.]|uniref:host attachment protein n=1 Tax=Lamprobacter sp. TaxID=3100796 RepID=UPI002B264223|nr:host attachment protein [Lamprobacter sp.]MEA3641670.1 host attachment protein [Lamprobacter sp.]
MPNSKLWLIVADEGRAALYAAESPTGPLTELRDFIGAENRLLDQDLVTDRPGRAFDSGGEGRHALEPSTQPGEVEAQRFAKRLTEILDQARTEHRFEMLGLVAPPAFLGLLRKSLSDEAARQVVLEIDKDLTRYDAEGVRAHLPERLFETPLA